MFQGEVCFLKLNGFSNPLISAFLLGIYRKPISILQLFTKVGDTTRKSQIPNLHGHVYKIPCLDCISIHVHRLYYD